MGERSEMIHHRYSVRLLSAATLGALVACFALAAFFALKPNSRVVYDERSHHLPAILQFSEQLPAPQLHDYPVATTPGYHLMMAAAHRYLGLGEGGLRAISILVSVGLAAVVGWELSRRNAPGVSIALGLPLMLCVYVVTSSAWLLPENAAWALVAAILVLALRKPSTGSLILMSLALTALVLVRQAHVWCAAVVVAAAMVDQRTRPEPRQAALGLAAALPALAVLTGFVILWGGLVPPMFQPGGREYQLSTQYGGWGPAAPTFTLALVGFYGIVLLPWFWPGATAARSRSRLLLILAIGATIGLLLGVLPETTYQIPHRRSGIWRLVQMLPHVLERSPVIWVLSMVGGAVGATVLLAVDRRDRWIMSIAMVAFMLVQCANPMIWQRYYEPWVLIWLLIAAGRVDRSKTTRLTGFTQRAGLAGLILLQIAITLYTLRGSGE